MSPVTRKRRDAVMLLVKSDVTYFNSAIVEVAA